MPRGRTWVRIDARIHCDPDLMAIGPWAVVAFEGLVRIAKMLGTAGHLAPKIRAPAYVSAAAWGWASDSAETRAIADALARLVTACDGRSDGPVVTCACSAGCLRIRTWEDWQSDPTHADRQARYRARASGQLPVQSDAHGTPGDVPVTPTGRPSDMEGEGEVDTDQQQQSRVDLQGPDFAVRPNLHASECHLCHQRVGPGAGFLDGKSNGKALVRHRVCPPSDGDGGECAMCHRPLGGTYTEHWRGRLCTPCLVSPEASKDP